MENQATVHFTDLYVWAADEMALHNHRHDRHYGAAWAYFRVAAECFGDERALHISRMIHEVADRKEFAIQRPGSPASQPNEEGR